MTVGGTKPREVVSIILPAFNAIKFLPEAVESVIKQTHGRWQLIIVNDGSTDGTREFLDGLSHDFIQCLHQQNRGVSAARNAGLELATGKYVTFLDADDILPPRSLEHRVRFLEENPDVDLVDGVVSVRDERFETELRRYEPYYRGQLLPRLLKLDSRVFFNVCYMFRRSVLGNVRFPEHMTHAEDLAFFMLLAHERDLSYGHVNEEVYYYRSSDASAMSNMEGLERGYVDFLGLVDEYRMASGMTRQALRLRVAKILLLSWRARGESSRGVAAAMRVMTG